MTGAQSDLFRQGRDAPALLVRDAGGLREAAHGEVVAAAALSIDRQARRGADLVSSIAVLDHFVVASGEWNSLAQLRLI